MLSDLILDSTHPHVVYVTNRHGVFRSEDGGLTWEARSAGLTNINIRALAMSAVDSDVLYVGPMGRDCFVRSIGDCHGTPCRWLLRNPCEAYPESGMM